MEEQASPEDQFKTWLSSQSGYTGKDNKASWWNNYNQSQSNDASLKNLMSNEPTELSMTGSPQETAGRIEGLQRAKILTGQTPQEQGQDVQQAYGNVKKRAGGTDTGSEMLRASKAGAVADARNQMQQQGVKGGAALGAVSSVERAKSYDVNNQLVDAQQKAQTDYMNAAKANANFTTAAEMNYGAMAGGKNYRAPAQNSSGFQTVICTELHKQGFISDETIAADQRYGAHVRETFPEIYVGYRFLADPIVKGMKKSKLFTRVVALFAVPWSEHMCGRKSVLGTIVGTLGEPLCFVVGTLIGGKDVQYSEKI